MWMNLKEIKCITYINQNSVSLNATHPTSQVSPPDD